MKEKHLNYLEIAKRVFNWVLVIIAVAVMAFTIFSVSTFDRNNRSVFGYKLFIDLTDSMSPDYFNAGDVVIVKNVEDKTTIQPGDIITYQSLMEGETYGNAVTHMVRSLTTDAQGNPGFVTYGVATGADDSVIVTYDFVLGKYVGRIPRVGYLFQYLKTPVGYILLILIPFLLLIGMQGLNCIQIFKKYRKEQLQTMEAEKAAIAEERAESQRMMAELLALKAQLAQTSAAPAEQAPPQTPLQAPPQAPPSVPASAPATAEEKPQETADKT